MKCSIIFVALTLIVGCGTFGPVVESTRSEETSSQRFVQVEALEGRSTSIVLEIRTLSPTSPGDRLEIYRAHDGGEYSMLQLVALDEQLAAAIAEGIQYVDRDVPSGSVSYVAVVIRPDDDAHESVPLDIDWSDAPPRPDRLEATALTHHSVELEWNVAAPAVAVFRRNVLDPESRPVRLAELKASPSRFVDGKLTPGGVYAYRIAFASERDGFLHFGAPTEEVYVTIPGEAKP